MNPANSLSPVRAVRLGLAGLLLISSAVVVAVWRAGSSSEAVSSRAIELKTSGLAVSNNATDPGRFGPLNPDPSAPVPEFLSAADRTGKKVGYIRWPEVLAFMHQGEPPKLEAVPEVPQVRGQPGEVLAPAGDGTNAVAGSPGQGFDIARVPLAVYDAKGRRIGLLVAGEYRESDMTPTPFEGAKVEPSGPAEQLSRISSSLASSVKEGATKG